MARFLRVIKQGRWFKKSNWDQVGNEDSPSDPLFGLQSDALLDLQRDALLDLQTDANALSVFKIENEADVNRVVVALASKRDNPAHFDYAVFDDESLLPCGISFVQNEGETPDYEVNQMHYDVINLTVLKLVNVARAVSLGEIDRMPQKILTINLKEAFNGHRLQLGDVNAKLLDKLR